MIAIQSQRIMRLVNDTSIFKPSIAKYLTIKYSDPKDTIFDYSCGFGGRLLGVISSDRKYIGTDPMTTEELSVMGKALNINCNDYILIKSGSENYCGLENSIDLSFSSP